MNVLFCFLLFFFCKQKTAYEMRISDWSSDVCSSDLSQMGHGSAKAPMEGMDHSKMDHGAMQSESGSMDHSQMGHGQSQEKAQSMDHSKKNGRESCRERVCQYV